MLVFILNLIGSGLLAQHLDVRKHTNVSHLKAFALESTTQYNIAKEKALKHAREQGWPVRFTDEQGNFVELQYMNEVGLPVYYQTFNTGAAKTTSTVTLHPGGTLNTSVAGKGMQVGVWDGGAVKGHVEFNGRAKPQDGKGEKSNHATHVTGTIIAAGVSSSAKGMAYEAEALTYDWNNDMAEIADQAASGLLLSNHSYGLVLGWTYSEGEWKWYGGDAEEDYRFGFYDVAHSQTIDQIMFDAPYYTIVWAAGNDRTDVGDGSKKADGPFDSIGPEGAAKNNIVVGAVEKISDYSGPESVKMSSFSSWGPVDDGRIKPDIVGAGVSIFSTMADGDDTYSTMSGTSMASPNVTGSLLLLQQLYNQHNPGQYMRSATLKGLAIHTAKEAGPAPGPDYMYGWGLLDTEAGARAILDDEPGKEYKIEELVLENAETKLLKVKSDGQGPLKVTVCWTDPAGTPAAPSINPTKLMLVNDLDVRILDEAGNSVSPWTLNPASPGIKASRGDNFRDNVEVVYIENPTAQEYTIQINHKGELTNGQQSFSMITEYTNNQAIGESFYWIGGEGNWQDASHWSKSSGGSPAGEVPSAKDRVIFDNQSALEEGHQVFLSSDAAAYSFKWFAPGTASMVLENDAQLTVQGGVVIGTQGTSVEGMGSFRLVGDGTSVINLNAVTAPGLSLVLDNPNGIWSINSDFRADKLIVNSGGVEAKNISLHVNSLFLERSSVLDLSNSVLDISQTISFPEQKKVTITNTVFRFSPSEENELHNLIADSLDFSHVEVLQGNVRFSGPNSYERLIVHPSILTLLETNAVQAIELLPGASLVVSEGDTLRIEESFNAYGEAENFVSLRSASGEGAYLELDVHQKVCADYLQVSGINALGKATFNAGKNSTVETAEGWQTKLCEDVLFAEFGVEYACAGAIANFENLSSGTVEEAEWVIEGPDGIVTLTELAPTYTFEQTGTYQLTLTVKEGEDESSYTKVVEIQENSLKKPAIVVNDNVLAATTPSDTYQWYKDGKPVEGATGRTYNTEGAAGVYQVTVLNEICNAASEPIVITSVLEEYLLDEAVKTLKIYANPVKDNLLIEGVVSNGRWEAQVFDMSGKAVTERHFSKDQTLLLEMKHLRSGMYLLKMNINSRFYTYKILKK